jgi:hypothetical protein
MGKRRKHRAASPRETPKTAAKPPELVPQPHGGALLSGGLVGNKGGTGRPPLAFKALCKDILEDPATQENLRLAAQSPGLSGYASVLKLLADHGEGVPMQTVNLLPPGRLSPEEIREAIRSIVAGDDTGDR